MERRRRQVCEVMGADTQRSGERGIEESEGTAGEESKDRSDRSIQNAVCAGV